MFGKSKILMALALAFTLIFAATPKHTYAENMHMPDGASIMNMMDVVKLANNLQ